MWTGAGCQRVCKESSVEPDAHDSTRLIKPGPKWFHKTSDYFKPCQCWDNTRIPEQTGLLAQRRFLHDTQIECKRASCFLFGQHECVPKLCSNQNIRAFMGLSGWQSEDFLPRDFNASIQYSTNFNHLSISQLWGAEDSETFAHVWHGCRWRTPLPPHRLGMRGGRKRVCVGECAQNIAKQCGYVWK